MKKIERAATIIERMPQEKRARMKDSILRLRNAREVDEALAVSVVCDLILIEDRFRRKKAGDRESNHRKRRTLGARVPAELYYRCKHDAESKGVSLYRWVLSAYEMALVLPWTD